MEAKNSPQTAPMSQSTAVNVQAAKVNYPTMNPPMLNSDAGFGAWNSNLRIVGTWSIAESRNFWINVGTIGWRKCANNSDSAIMSLGILCTAARQNNNPVNYFETDDANKLIAQIYVW